MADDPGRSARCDCGAPATNQALYRRDDGTHFLGSPMCGDHSYPLGRPRYAQHVEIVDHVALKS